MQKNKIDMKNVKAICLAMAAQTGYKGEVAGINEAMDILLEIPDNDLFKEIDQARWEAIVDLEFKTRDAVAKLQDKLTGIKQVRAIYQLELNTKK